MNDTKDDAVNNEELKKLENNLVKGADLLRANTGLKSSEYSTPVLGIIFLRFADNRYQKYEESINAEYQELKGGRREKKIADIAIEKCGFYLPDIARYDYLLNLPEQENIAKALKEAMVAIEKHKPELEGVLPQDEFFRLVTDDDKSTPKSLLKLFADIPKDADGDVFGQIYEFFLGWFAMAEGQGGGEFFTPRSVVRLMVEIIEPHRGKVFDPACGSGGMFVQSAKFIEEHRKSLTDSSEDDLFVSGQEKTGETVKLAKMNLAVSGLRGDIREANSYYDDPFDSFEKFDYVLANPPFNVDEVNYSRVENDKRFNSYGIPRNKTKKKKADQGNETVPNANYMWINLFATSLKPKGRAALVMANSASDARHSEADIRKTLIENNLIYGMLTLPSNMFYTVTLPATLWFFDKDKQDENILFIDARNIFNQIDRAHREFTEEQTHNIAIISQLHRGKRERFTELVDSYFTKGETKLAESHERVEPVAKQIEEVMTSAEGKAALKDLLAHWDNYTQVQQATQAYQQSFSATSDVEQQNQAQHRLTASVTPFFEGLHSSLKQLDKAVRAQEKQAALGGKRTDRDMKALKTSLEEIHKEVKEAESFFAHIRWLQERFPQAKYEDVTGLCKLANMAEVEEQDYSLNPGRYVGVVIEEDGKTEEEFTAEILDLNDELEKLNAEARELESVITDNVKALVGE